MRAFVAIRPPAAVLDEVDARVTCVPLAGARPTTREQWHITLQFLGDDVDVDAVGSALGAAPIGVGPGEVRVGGARAVGGRTRRSRILALGLSDGAEWTEELAGAVGRRLAPLGYAPESGREFRAHLTLARFRVPTDLRPLHEAVGSDPVGPAWRVDDFVLFESQLGPGGARHVVRDIFPLGP
jgi:2'-5' RNA ligase